MNILKDLHVLDLTRRLPGPLSTLQLSKLGAQVTKVMDDSAIDPFFKEGHKLFNDWGQNLNASKETTTFSFKANPKKLEALLNQSQIVFSSLPQKKIEDLGIKVETPVTVSLHASRQSQHLHDLNILADSGLLHFHLNQYPSNLKSYPPPMLPIAGIVFSELLALKGLAHYVAFLKTGKNQIVECYMDELVIELLSALKPSIENQEEVHAHNGAFPCYRIYKTKDHFFFALAALEKHFWEFFCQKFNLQQLLNQQYSSDEKVIALIEKTFQSLRKEEILKLTPAKMCLSLVQ